MPLRLIRSCLVFGVLILGGCNTGNWYADNAAIPAGDLQLNLVLTPCDTLPRFLSGKSPSLPEVYRGTAGGKVVLEFTIDETGTVHKIIGREEIGKDFLMHTAAAVYGWRFSPALKDGKPIAVQVRQTFNFFDDLTDDPIDRSGQAETQGYKALRKKNYDLAIDRFTEQIRLAEYDQFRGFFGRAQAYEGKRDYAKAIADCNEVIRLDSNSAAGLNQLAWIEATCPDPTLRDGPHAVIHAKRACGLLGWTYSSVLDTLAAAYAESGDFDQAVAMQQKAIASTPPSDPKAKLPGMRERLQLYQRQIPYRDNT